MADERADPSPIGLPEPWEIDQQCSCHLRPHTRNRLQPLEVAPLFFVFCDHLVDLAIELLDAVIENPDQAPKLRGHTDGQACALVTMEE